MGYKYQKNLIMKLQKFFQNPNNYRKAFSFVEIAVVILIVAVTLIGVMQGRELYLKMRLNSARLLTDRAPIDLINDLSIWVESTSERSFENKSLVNSDKISKWVNLKTEPEAKFDFSQATVNSQPVYYENAINGLPAVRFNNAQTLQMTSTEISNFISSNEVTIFMVQQSYVGDTTTSSFGWNNGGYRLLTHTGGGAIYFDFGVCCPASGRTSTASIVGFLNSNNIITFYKNFSNVKIRHNAIEKANSTVATSSIPDNLTGVFTLGKYPPDNAYFFLGHIGEFIVFRRALNDSEIDLVEKYLSEKWAIAI